MCCKVGFRRVGGLARSEDDFLQLFHGYEIDNGFAGRRSCSTHRFYRIPQRISQELQGWTTAQQAV